MVILVIIACKYLYMMLRAWKLVLWGIVGMRHSLLLLQQKKTFTHNLRFLHSPIMMELLSA